MAGRGFQQRTSACLWGAGAEGGDGQSGSGNRPVQAGAEQWIHPRKCRRAIFLQTARRPSLPAASAALEPGRQTRCSRPHRHRCWILSGCPVVRGRNQEGNAAAQQQLDVVRFWEKTARLPAHPAGQAQTYAATGAIAMEAKARLKPTVHGYSPTPAHHAAGPEPCTAGWFRHSSHRRNRQ